MSDTADQPADLPAILARIDRDLAESAKLREESNKFAAEQHKLLAEQQKLYAEQQSSTRSSKALRGAAKAGPGGREAQSLARSSPHRSFSDRRLARRRVHRVAGPLTTPVIARAFPHSRVG
jgi:hypothetical protein